MSDAWFAAFALLALLSLTSAILLVAVMRQVGILHQRLADSDGFANSPRAGSLVDPINLAAVPGAPSEDAFQAAATVFAFVTPGCGGCDDVPDLIRAASSNGHPDGVQIVLATEAGDKEAQEYFNKHKAEVPFVRSDEFARHFGIPGSPYFVAVRQEDDRLRIIAGSIPRSPDDLLELIEFASNQDRDSGKGPDALKVEQRPAGVDPAVRERIGGSAQ